jgi:hypothetical protein
VTPGRLALTLLVARILAKNANDALALHDFAGFAQSLYRGSYFHISNGFWLNLVPPSKNGGFWGQKNPSGKSLSRERLLKLLPEGYPPL